MEKLLSVLADLKLWLWVLAVAAAAIGAIVLVSKYSSLKLSEAAAVVSSVVTAVAFLLAYRTLKAAHEWNRRHFTITHLARWNEHARPHLSFLEKEFPKYFQVPNFLERPEKLDEWHMDQVVAKGCCDKSDERASLISDHLIELFNHFENIALAYEQNIVDRAVIDDTLSVVITDVCLFFQPFINQMRTLNRSDPWPPLSRVVDLWIAGAKRKFAQEDVAKARQRHKEALEKAKRYQRTTTEN